jgi:hypothetical protein
LEAQRTQLLFFKKKKKKRISYKKGSVSLFLNSRIKREAHLSGIKHEQRTLTEIYNYRKEKETQLKRVKQLLFPNEIASIL